MNDLDPLNGIGSDVESYEVATALRVLKDSMSLMEVDEDEMYDIIRVLEVIYDAEPARPNEEGIELVRRVIENVDFDEVTSLEPEYVEERLETLEEIIDEVERHNEKD